MHIHLLGHHTPSTNGAPQVVAVGFASLVILTLVLPFIEVSSIGTTAPANLVVLLRTEAGFNLFVAAALLVPVLGIAAAFAARSSWRVVTMLVALAGVLVVLLALLTLNRGVQAVTHGLEFASPGLGLYIVLLGYATIAVATGIAAFRARHAP